MPNRTLLRAVMKVIRDSFNTQTPHPEPPLLLPPFWQLTLGLWWLYPIQISGTRSNFLSPAITVQPSHNFFKPLLRLIYPTPYSTLDNFLPPGNTNYSSV